MDNQQLQTQQIQTPDWAKQSVLSYPIWTGAPRNYRFDGSTGKFLVGSESEVEELWIQLIDWRWQEGVRWGRQSQEWLDIAFADSEGVVSVCSLKKASAVNFFDVAITQMQSGRRCDGTPANPMAVWNVLKPVPCMTNDGQSYYVVAVTEFNFASREQFEGIQEFVASGLLNWLLVGEVEDGYGWAS